ncbi:MAG: aminotransferase class I/II-fold pyridoxal phosphate-dependent enzyme, partial [Acidimicrobiales bacterium]|nr:aminotransferase class I/II-fold pyridoxal phosphate-dependent enzyme [Acidimicrobiales bacterium]
MATPTSWDRWVAERNRAVAATGRRRHIRDLDGGTPATTVSGDGRPVVSFASNDYLGLTQHPTVIAAAVDTAARRGTGSGSARLIVGARPEHRALEADLAAWKGSEAALLFSTGFAAN